MKLSIFLIITTVKEIYNFINKFSNSLLFYTNRTKNTQPSWTNNNRVPLTNYCRSVTIVTENQFNLMFDLIASF